eukprot:6182386-Pleurochrysis_carterae.AAC.1
MKEESKRKAQLRRFAWLPLAQTQLPFLEGGAWHPQTTEDTRKQRTYLGHVACACDGVRSKWRAPSAP